MCYGNDEDTIRLDRIEKRKRKDSDQSFPDVTPQHGADFRKGYDALTHVPDGPEEVLAESGRSLLVVHGRLQHLGECLLIEDHLHR